MQAVRLAPTALGWDRWAAFIGPEVLRRIRNAFEGGRLPGWGKAIC